jgi:hypothetical protein
MHGRCLTLHGGRHACEYACVHTTKALLVLHACMTYLYVCMCGCTADTCLLVLCMLLVHASCLCALLVCVVNGKSGCLPRWVFWLALLAVHIRMCYCQKRKVRGGTRCHGGLRAAAVSKGVRARVRCGGDGGGVGARAVVGHRAKRERGREVKNRWVMPMSRSRIKLKRGNWDGYKMDKI